MGWTEADVRYRGPSVPAPFRFALSLVWAVLDLFFRHASHGATFTDVDRQHLHRIKCQQADPDTIDEEITAA